MTTSVDVGVSGDMAGSMRPARDVALDMLKGILVVVMVLYHAMNVFSTAGVDEYAYVRFVSGSFIVVSGFVVARFYGAAFDLDALGVSKRLLWRGAKLIILFTALNVLIRLTGVGNPAKSHAGGDLFDHPFDGYILGRQGVASFQILLPIAYTLMVAPLLLLLRKKTPLLLGAVLLMMMLVATAESDSVNLEFAVLGVIGLAGGMAVDSRKIALPKLQLPFTIGGLVAMVLLMKYFSRNFAPYTIATIAILRLLYDLCTAIAPRSVAGQGLALLGKYSLFAYIAQILVLQLLARALGRPRWELGVELFAVVVATTVVLLACCLLLEVLSARSRAVAKLYRLLFA